MSTVRSHFPFVAFAVLISMSGCAKGPDTTPDSSSWEPFVTLAKSAQCADKRNRLFVIDRELVLWDRAGNCPDNGYSMKLYRRTPDDLVCSASDSIAGPMKKCAVPSYQELFEVAIAHLDDPNLGLGPGHTVQSVAVSP